MRKGLAGVLAASMAAAVGCAATSSGQPPAARRPSAPDALDSLVVARMTRRQIPGVSLAIVKGGRVVDVRAYGVTERGGTVPVTPRTLFQAASISKPVTSLGVLRLVEAGTLSLDDDVNARLRSWTLPDSPLAARERVTVRRLLSHTAGLNVRGIPGHPTSAVLPSLRAAMSGEGNTPALEIVAVPGSTYRYSGGGYAVLQQLVEDVTGTAFGEYMERAVLAPLGMSRSTFAVPLPPDRASDAATGHTLARAPIAGRWHDIREVAAAGLWTTPSDLARFVVGLADAAAGRSTLLSAPTARLMTTPVLSGYGLGLSIDGSGDRLRFYHGGQNHGFESYISGNPATGDGAVLMINTNDGGSFIWSVMSHIAKTHAWPSYPVWEPDRVERAAAPPELLRALTGDYALSASERWSLRPVGDRLLLYRNDLPDEEFVHARDGRFVSLDRQAFFRVVRSASGDVEAIEWNERSQPRRLARVGGASGR